MDLDWGELLSFAVVSGAAAGVMNQIARFIHDLIADRRTKESQRRELEHQRTLRREDREHQDAVRSEVSFFESRNALLGDAVCVRDYIDWWWGHLYGADVDYHPVSLNPPTFGSPADAISALRKIAGLHTTRHVRALAQDLADSVDTRVNTPDNWGNSDPTFEQLGNWVTSAEGLIEAMHGPRLPK